MRIIQACRTALIAASVLLTIGTSAWIAAAEGGGAAQKTSGIFGDPGFVPTSERPVGWRGDGSGRYPGATPPLEWGRWLTGPFSALRCRAVPSAGEPIDGRPLADGIPQEWLILGPIKVDDAVAAMGTELIPGEGTVQAKDGAKVGERTWLPYREDTSTQASDYAMLTVDFAKAFAMADKVLRQNGVGGIEPNVAYATTAIYAKEAVRTGILCEGSAANLAKLWLNGKAVESKTIELVPGWNRFVIKAGSTKNDWRVKFRLSPQAPLAYETRHVQWMTALPGCSWSSPIIVGDRIFVGADMGVLVCVDKTSGRILWAKATTWYDGLPEADRQAMQGKLAPVIAEIDAAVQALVNDSNAQVSKTGLPSEQFEALRRRVEAKNALESKVITLLQEQDKKRFAYWSQHTGTSHATPVSDGKTVYTHFWGGCKAQGASVICAFDLDGKRKWTYFTEQTGVAEHGDHSSPVLIGDRIFFALGDYNYALSKLDGKLLWRQPAAARNWGQAAGGTGLRCRIGNDDLLIDPCGFALQPADGTTLGKLPGLNPLLASPVVEGDVIYTLGGPWHQGFVAGRLISPGAGDGAYKVLYTVSAQELLHPSRVGEYNNMGGGLYVSSPLIVDGLAYCVSGGGILSVLDIATGKAVYKQVLDLAPRLIWVFYDGVCSSPTLAGKHIYITDDQSRTVVIEAGRTFKQVARNELANYNGQEHEQSQSNLVFAGSRMYYRSQGYLYCIGEK